MINQFTLLLGGARSGKSTHAETLCKQQGEQILYIATAEAGDDEMAERIKNHQAQRPSGWVTLETRQNVAQAFRDLNTKPDAVLLDCLTLLVSNILFSFPENTTELTIQAAIDEELNNLVTTIRQSGCPWYIVANEVGLGLVPPYPVGRLYRDLLGRANQKLAAEADRVLFMVAGIPMIVK